MYLSCFAPPLPPASLQTSAHLAAQGPSYVGSADDRFKGMQLPSCPHLAFVQLMVSAPYPLPFLLIPSPPKPSPPSTPPSTPPPLNTSSPSPFFPLPHPSGLPSELHQDPEVRHAHQAYQKEMALLKMQIERARGEAELQQIRQTLDKLRGSAGGWSGGTRCRTEEGLAWERDAQGCSK